MLDLAQIARSGPESADLAAKQAALEAWVAEVLALHASATDAAPYTVVGYVDPRVTAAGLDGATVAAIMGTPARYAEVIWSGRTAGYDPTAPGLVFEVGVYFGTGATRGSGTEAADTASATAAFRSVAYRASATRPGILYAAERQDALVLAGGAEVALSAPEAVALGRTGDGHARPHLLTLSFTVTLS